MTKLVTEISGPRAFVSGSFDEFEDLSEAIAPWGLEFQQLDRGPTRAELVQISEPGAVLQRARFNRRYDQHGECPPATRTFGFIEPGVRNVQWCGSDLTNGELALFDSSGAFEASSRPGFGCITLSLSEDRLSDSAEILGMPEILDRLDRSAQRYQVVPAALLAFGKQINSALGALETSPGTLGSPDLDEMLGFELPAALLATVATSSPSPSPPRLRHRRQALARARTFIIDHLQEPPTVRQVCHATGVSWRTLDYAFREAFGMTPKAYLRALRLNAVRRDLLQAAPDEGVADIANRWGFWHAGQFAADYRQLFGELPSWTTGRSGPARPTRSAPPEE